MKKKSFSFLPLDPKPVHYQLTYTKVDLVSFDFEGTVSVSLEFGSTFENAPCTMIRLNALNLSILSAQLSDTRSMERMVVIPGEQVAEFYFEGSTRADTKLTLTISFSGKLNNILAGFYRSQLASGDSIGCTQFEPTDARRAFPCWDEPDRKATFQVTFVLPKQYVAYSNTRVQSRTSLQDSVTSVFYVTPRMSTYLLAWVIAPHADCFDFLSERSTLPPFVETTVFASKGRAEEARFALNVAVKAVDFFSDLFQVEYPLPLLQHFPIPDFGAGAMENWGLITYREARLLVDENKISSPAKRDVARVICHEVAHQWFGNLATMQWWTDLWLNEGFARFCEYLAVDHIFPELKVFTHFVSDVVGNALRLDGLKSTHAIRVEVKHPDEISEIFDAVSYAKGGSVNRMCVHFLGGLPQWVKGVQLYLQEHAYGNTVSRDLWDCIERSNQLAQGSFVRIMEEWTNQVGYPVIFVTSSLTQTRYLQDGSRNELEQQRWTIPVSFQSSRGTDFFPVRPPTVVSGSDQTVDEPTAALEEVLSACNNQGNWFVLNAKGDLFRVCYTKEQFRRICSCGFSILSVVARLTVIRDLFDLAESNHVELSLALDIGLSMLKTSQERDPVVLFALVSKLATVFALSKEHPVLTGLLFKCLDPLVSALGIVELGDVQFFVSNDDVASLNELRTAVLPLAVNVGFAEIGQVAVDRVVRHCQGTELCPNDLRPTLFRLALTRDAESILPLLLAHYGRCSQAEQKEILTSFSSLKQDKDVAKALEFVTSSQVRIQDVPSGVSALCFHGAKLVWAHFQAEYDQCWKRFSLGGFFLWSGIVSSIAGGMDTWQEARQVRVYFDTVRIGQLGSAQRALDQALEKVQVKEGVVRRYRAVLDTFGDMFVC